MHPTINQTALTTTIQCFFPEKHESHLQATVWFVSASGKNCWKNIILKNNAASTPEEMIEDVLRWMTGFVRERWIRIEVITPQRTEYGRIEGGYGRFLATRSFDDASDN